MCTVTYYVCMHGFDNRIIANTVCTQRYIKALPSRCWSSALEGCFHCYLARLIDKLMVQYLKYSLYWNVKFYIATMLFHSNGTVDGCIDSSVGCIKEQGNVWVFFFWFSVLAVCEMVATDSPQVPSKYIYFALYVCSVLSAQSQDCMPIFNIEQPWECVSLVYITNTQFKSDLQVFSSAKQSRYTNIYSCTCICAT